MFIVWATPRMGDIEPCQFYKLAEFIEFEHAVQYEDAFTDLFYSRGMDECPDWDVVILRRDQPYYVIYRKNEDTGAWEYQEVLLSIRHELRPGEVIGVNHDPDGDDDYLIVERPALQSNTHPLTEEGLLSPGFVTLQNMHFLESMIAIRMQFGINYHSV